jgi:hypothetical protein
MSIAGSIAGRHLFFTQMSLSGLGGTGAVGQAHVEEYSLSSFSGYDAIAPDAAALPDWLADPSHLPLTSYSDEGSVADLGAAYADPAGNLTAGAWQVSQRASVMVSQQVVSVDTKAGTVSSRYYGCTQFSYVDCPSILSGAAAAPLAVHPSFAISPDGGSVALTTNTLYTQSLGGGSVAKVAGAGCTCPPAWSPDNKHVAVTQLVSQSTDSSGVVRSVTNVLAVSGSSSALFIPGAQDLAWSYQ